MSKEIAESLINEAKGFNIFGPANLKGPSFQKRLLNKFKKWKTAIGEDKEKILFNKEELEYLKPIIAQSLIEDEVSSFLAYPPDRDQHHEVKDRIFLRVKHCLEVAKLFAKCGSANCDISNIVLHVALKNRITKGIEYINFSGVKDNSEDHLHSFLTIGFTEPTDLKQSLIRRLTEDDYPSNTDYFVCDGHHSEVYPVTEALSQPNTRLARYDDIFHKELPGARRFFVLDKPINFYDEYEEIRNLCVEVEEAKNDMTLKEETVRIFKSILLAPFKTQDYNQAFRRAAASGQDYQTYLPFLSQSFDVDVNSKGGGKTALHLALEKNHINCAKYLIEEMNADLDIENGNNVSARELIENSENEELKLLINWIRSNLI